MSTTDLLNVEDLTVTFRTRTGPVHAVRGVSFPLVPARPCIVGASGSGQSPPGRALFGPPPPPGAAQAPPLEFDRLDPPRVAQKTLRDLRGGRISMIMQDPKYSLNPVTPIGKQIVEAYLAHTKASKAEAREKSLDMLEAVQIRDPARVFDAYPHELSGGMGQRAMIAMMLITDPDLLIADEPTSALDVTVQLEILSILDDLVARRGMGLIFISHDLRLVSSFCNRVLVMYAGKVVEQLEASKLHEASHPYTRGLLNCLPKIANRQKPLPTLRRDAAWAL